MTGLTKHCTKCDVTQSIENFGPRMVNGRQNYQSRCRPCQNEASAKSRDKRYSTKEEYNAALVAYKKTPKGRLSWFKTKVRRQGLSESEVIRAVAHLEASDGRCEICKKKYPNDGNLYVDHCHTTMTFRGLLCGKCNSFIGLAKEDVEILKSAIKYLTQKQEVQE